MSFSLFKCPSLKRKGLAVIYIQTETHSFLSVKSLVSIFQLFNLTEIKQKIFKLLLNQGPKNSSLPNEYVYYLVKIFLNNLN